MAIKKLQSNYTTPEQSKRLLELGVPADSADCTIKPDGSEICKWHERYPIREFVEYVNNRYGYESYCYCWSVGRLIEISRICSTLPNEEWMFPFWKDQEDNIEWSIRVMESGIRTGNMDFSKLEDCI